MAQSGQPLAASGLRYLTAVKRGGGFISDRKDFSDFALTTIAVVSTFELRYDIGMYLQRGFGLSLWLMLTTCAVPLLARAGSDPDGGCDIAPVVHELPCPPEGSPSYLLLPPAQQPSTPGKLGTLMGRMKAAALRVIEAQVAAATDGGAVQELCLQGAQAIMQVMVPTAFGPNDAWFFSARRRALRLLCKQLEVTASTCERIMSQAAADALVPKNMAVMTSLAGVYELALAETDAGTRTWLRFHEDGGRLLGSLRVDQQLGTRARPPGPDGKPGVVAFMPVVTPGDDGRHRVTVSVRLGRLGSKRPSLDLRLSWCPAAGEGPCAQRTTASDRAPAFVGDASLAGAPHQPVAGFSVAPNKDEGREIPWPRWETLPRGDLGHQPGR